MGTLTVKLSFTSPVHFGQGRLSDSGYSCDAATLFSALYIEALHCGDQDELLAAAKSGELSISDAFPYVGDTMYLPKPQIEPTTQGGNQSQQPVNSDPRERKAYKKLSYISVARYHDFLSGNFDAYAELAQFDLGKSDLRTRVNTLRIETDDALPYHVGSYSFRPNTGLYFLVRGTYDISGLLEQLSYAGLGGKRSSGYGRFTFSVVQTREPMLTSAASSNATSNILLATATPREDELKDALLDGARYRLIRKGGFVQSATHSATPTKKRDIYLFATGSSFPRTFEGDVFDVNTTPGSHPVYRYARAFWMAV